MNQQIKGKFDWIPDSDLKTQILQTWDEFQQDPQTWRLNSYLALIAEVPIEEDRGNFKYDNPKHAVRFGDSHQPSLLDSW